MMALADQRSELIVRKTKLDAFAADVTIQTGFEQPVVADAVHRHLRAIFEPELRRAQFYVDKAFAECDEAKAQLQVALDKLKLFKEKVHGFEAMIRELQSAEQAALNAVGDKAQGRERDN